MRIEELAIKEEISAEQLQPLQRSRAVGRGLLAEQPQGAGAQELEGADAGFGSHGRRSGDPEAGRAGSRGSPLCNAERSAANAPVRLTCAALEAARTMRRAARSRSTERRWGRDWISPVRLWSLGAALQLPEAPAYSVMLSSPEAHAVFRTTSLFLLTAAAESLGCYQADLVLRQQRPICS